MEEVDLEVARARVPLSAAEKARLIPSLSTRVQLEELEKRSIHSARVWAMKRARLAPHDVLTEEFSRELHKRMFSGIWKRAGHYRQHAEPPGLEPAKIAEGVRLVLDDAECWLRFGTYPVHEAAVRLHYGLWCVRPWSDGNGNYARLMADVFVESQGEAPLTWGQRTFGTRFSAARRAYADATIAAGKGDMALMIAFATG
jgi:Fic-DOC domain mobile mystery protein B